MRGMTATPRSPFLVFAALVVAYEWLVSGLSKATHGGFVAGLPARLPADAKESGATYARLLRDVVIPHAHLFAVLVVVGEIAVGAGFVVFALARGRAARVGLGTVALVGASMTLNFQLAAGQPLFRLLTPDVFDEGVSLDALLTLLQLGFAVYGLAALRPQSAMKRLWTSRPGVGAANGLSTTA